MRAKKVLSVLLATAMASAMLAGCGGNDAAQTGTDANVESGTDANAGSDAQVVGESGDGGTSNKGDVKEFTAFFAVPGSEINDDNEIQQMIAEMTGVRVKETWLTGQTAQEAVGDCRRRISGFH